MHALPFKDLRYFGFQAVVCSCCMFAKQCCCTVPGPAYPECVGSIPGMFHNIFPVADPVHVSFLLLLITALHCMLLFVQDLKDLLDPSRTLKLREDAKRGFFVEGAKEEILLSPKHAMSVVAAGQQNRTVTHILSHMCCFKRQPDMHWAEAL